MNSSAFFSFFLAMKIMVKLDTCVHGSRNNNISISCCKNRCISGDNGFSELFFRTCIDWSQSDSSWCAGSCGCRGEMMLMLVSLLSSVPAFKACLQCDRMIRRLHEDFVLSAPTVDDQIEMKKICDHAYVTYKETSWERKGVIGETKTRLSATCNGMSFRSPKFFLMIWQLKLLRQWQSFCSG